MMKMVDLKMRVGEMFNNAEVVMKYRIMPEDLDVFVSITCDEDLRHMLDEYDRQEPRSPSNSSRFRLFIFSAAPPRLSSISDLSATSLEQRYVEVINGVSPAAISTCSLMTISSAFTSPTSRDAFPAARPNVLFAAGGGGEGLHWVQSTPNLGRALCRMANGVVGNGLGPLHGCQQQHHHHRHRHHNHGQQGPPVSVGGVLRRMGSAPVPCEARVRGCGCQRMAPPHVRRYHHLQSAGPALGSGGCVWFGHAAEAGGVLSPRDGPPHSLPFGVPARKPTAPCGNEWHAS